MPAAHPKTDTVTVTLVLTDPDGNTQTEDKNIADGPTKTTELKTELGVPEETALWVIDKAGKKKQLGDHESHDVKAGDRFEALVRGGIS
jgi:hypothetical protein